MNRIFCICFFLLSSLHIGAQNSSSFGIKQGLSISNQFGDSIDGDNHFKVGIEFGLLCHIQLNEAISFQTEIAYLSKGMRYKDDELIKLHYSNIPVMFQYNIKSINEYYLSLGAYFGMLLSAKDNFGFTLRNISNRYSDIDYGITGGGGISLPAGKNTIMIDLRYNHGLPDVYSYDRLSIQNGNISLSVAYLFAQQKNERKRR